MKPLINVANVLRIAEQATKVGAEGGGFLAEVSKVTNLAQLASSQSKAALLVLAEKSISQLEQHCILGQQIPNLIKSKPPLDVIFKHKQAKDEFDMRNVNLAESLGSVASKVLPVNIHEQRVDPECLDLVISIAISQSIRQQKKLLLPDGIDLKQYRKLYISGHGKAGWPKLRSDETEFSITELVDNLEKEGILQAIKDLRFTSCGSADMRELRSMKPEDIKHANRPHNWLERQLKEPPIPFIEHVSQEIWKRGYTDVKVTGYHGCGIFYENGVLPTSHIRNHEIKKSHDEAPSGVKRSTVKVVLEHPSVVQARLAAQAESELE